MASIYDWSTTALSNANADSEINWAEGQDPGTVNDSAREMMRKLTVFRQMVGGALATAGTSTAYTLTYNHAPAAYVQGFYVVFEAHITNTGAATLNVNGVGAVSLRKNDGTVLVASELVGGRYYMATYDSTAGHFILLNVQGAVEALEMVTLTVTGNATVGGTLDVTGNLSSLGIDDNAGSTVFTLVSGEMQLGTGVAANDFRIDMRGITDGFLELGGGNVHSGGSNIELYGSTHATQAYDIIFSTGNTDRLMWDQSVTQWDFLGESVVGINNLTVTGNITTLGIDDNATAEALQLTDSVMQLGQAAANFTLRRNVDDQNFIVSGGNTSTSGGNIVLSGSTHATTPSRIDFRDDATSVLQYNTATGWDFQGNAVSDVGDLTATGNLTTLGIDDNATATALVLQDGVMTLGAGAANFTIQQASDTNFMALSGGTASNVGANLLMYGSTHATVARDVLLRSETNSIYRWDDSADQHSWYANAGTERMTLTNAELYVDADIRLSQHRFRTAVSGSAANPAIHIDEDGIGGGTGFWGTNTGTSDYLGIAVDGLDVARIFNDEVRLYSTNINREINTDRLNVSGGNASSAGGNISMWGGSHSTRAGDVALRVSATEKLTWDNSAGYWNFHDEQVYGVDEVVRGLTDDLLNLSGGSTATLGANIRLFAESHVGNANDIQFRVDGAVITLWDDSDSHWDFNGNDITEVGELRFSDSTSMSTYNSWQRSYTTAVIDITTTIPQDNTAPTTAETVSIASIASVAVGATEDVEIAVMCNGWHNDHHMGVCLFRDTTCIAVVGSNGYQTNDRAVGTCFTYVDAPGAGTYTYELRVGSLTGSTTNMRVNARDATGNAGYGSAGRSGLAVRVLE